MPKICYDETIKLRGARAEAATTADAVLREYAHQGYTLTLRQLYYQFVARGLLANSQKSYNWLGSVINDARLAGLIDWRAIVDRTRGLRGVGHWETPGDIIASSANAFRLDKWVGQANRVEVWIEKDALVGVIERVCVELDVPFLSCRGYTSQSEMWGAAQRMLDYQSDGQRPVVLHFGDHDPSGVDMTRDIRHRLRDVFEVTDVHVERVALRMSQVERYQPPPNPAKLSDSRCRAYIDKYGSHSWELDALEPKVLTGLVRARVQHYCDTAKWDALAEQERQHRAQLQDVAREWTSVTNFLDRDTI